MSERISIEIPSDMKKEIEELQEILKMDKSSVIRYLISKSIREIKLKTILKEYKRGKLSIGNAAKRIGINLWEFIEYCYGNNVQLDLTKEEAELGIKKVKKLDVKEYKKVIKEKLSKTKDKRLN